MSESALSDSSSAELYSDPLSSRTDGGSIPSGSTWTTGSAAEHNDEEHQQAFRDGQKVEHRNIVKDDPRHFREDPIAFMMHAGAFYQGTGWRAYDRYIGQKILYKSYTTEMIQRVLSNKKLQTLIHELSVEQATELAKQREQSLSQLSEKKRKKLVQRESEEEYRSKKQADLEKELQAVAREILQKMASDMSSIRHVRFAAFVVNNILVRMYNQGIHVRSSEILEIRRYALRAQEKKHSLIILPSHKSHVDYLVISYIFFRLGLALPHIAAGDNLNFPVVGPFLKGAGAFYIRRSWGGDRLYTAIATQYVHELLDLGHTLQCFVEGTRSRTGKLLPPKLGILKIVLEYFLSPDTPIDKDAILVPMNIGYDKVIETESYVNELLGNPKEKESLWGLATNTRLLQLKMGRIDVRFGKPFSMREFINKQFAGRQGFNPNEILDHKSILLKAFGYRILSDINAATVVMPTALVGTVLLTLRGRGVGRNELIRRVDWLRRQILSKQGQVADFGGKSTAEVVDRACEVIRGLVAERKDKSLLETTFYAAKRFELSYYRNQVMHLFVDEAITSAALFTKIKIGGSKSTQRMTVAELREEVSFLSSLLKSEFVYKPGTVDANLDRTLRYLINNGILEYDGEMVGLSDAERSIGRENYDFYCFLIWPFVETYWLATVSLLALTPAYMSTSAATGSPIEVTWVVEKNFFSKSQALGKTLFYSGDLSYIESINKETLKNAFDHLEQQRIIMVRRSRSNTESTAVALHPSYIPRRRSDGTIIPEGLLWELIERIGRFRREGKSRRDDIRVFDRLLRFAELVSKSNVVSVAVPASDVPVTAKL
ncbi:uncharacterized protein VTP21DRAFT_3941 [Calcarisporiella thermophila]|uniref:uncharacterized protein n=1 Tax=Calcarisporiella thermophila TaxID=911321 RepID=UPI0037430D05